MNESPKSPEGYSATCVLRKRDVFTTTIPRLCFFREFCVYIDLLGQQPSCLDVPPSCAHRFAPKPCTRHPICTSVRIVVGMSATNITVSRIVGFRFLTDTEIETDLPHARYQRGEENRRVYVGPKGAGTSVRLRGPDNQVQDTLAPLC